MLSEENKKQTIGLAIDIATKIGLLFIILYISYLIIKPFLPIIVWGIIIAVALSPLIEMLVKRLGNRKKIIIAVATIFILALAIPTWKLSGTLISSTQTLINSVNKQEITVPKPSENVKKLPIIGDEIYKIWSDASKDLPKTLEPFHPKIKSAILWLVGVIKSAFTTILMTMVSIVIAAIFLISKDSSVALYRRIMNRLVGKERGEDWTKLSALTVQSVATGVVGVAVFQSILAMIGMVPMGVPLAPVWALAIMFITIIQMPAILVIGPLIAYEYSVASGTSATIFAIYMIIVGFTNDVLKPIVMGRGVDIPMLVILIGAIGGMMLMGLIGLFIGSVILALTYKLFDVWISETQEVEISNAENK